MKKIINRLGIVHYSTPPIIGGVEEVVKYHSRLFLDDGYYIRIITGEGERFDPDIDLVIIPELRARLRSGFCEDLKMKILESLNKVITDLDLLIVHNIMTMPLNISLTAAIADLAQNIPIIAWTHDLAIFDPNYQFPKDEYPWSLITRRNEGMTYVVISDYRKEQLEELFGDSNSIVIPNGVDLFRISGCDTELTMVIEPLIYKGAIGLMPGRLVRRKNFEFAIRIIAALNRRMSSTLLLTAPVDPHNPDTVNYHNELKKLIGEMGIGDKVIFLSERIDLSDWGRVRTLYTIADFLLLTSRIEGFGLPVVEAGVMKTPIFASRIPPIESLVNSSGVFLFDLDDDPDEVGSMIYTELNGSPNFQLKQRIISEFTWKAIYEKKIRPLLKDLDKFDIEGKDLSG